MLARMLPDASRQMVLGEAPLGHPSGLQLCVECGNVRLHVALRRQRGSPGQHARHPPGLQAACSCREAGPAWDCSQQAGLSTDTPVHCDRHAG